MPLRGALIVAVSCLACDRRAPAPVPEPPRVYEREDCPAVMNFPGMGAGDITAVILIMLNLYAPLNILGMAYREVTDFDAHVRYMEGFHRRYMASNLVLRAWVAMVRTLDVETIAPQHGAIFRGREMVGRFLDWCESLQCGSDLMLGLYKVPEGA